MIIVKQNPILGGTYPIGITISDPEALAEFTQPEAIYVAGTLTSPEHCTSIELSYTGTTYPDVDAAWDDSVNSMFGTDQISVTAFYDDGREATADVTIVVYNPE